MKNLFYLLVLGLAGLFAVSLYGCVSLPKTEQAADASLQPCLAVIEDSVDSDLTETERAQAVAATRYLWKPQHTVTRETTGTLILKVVFLDGTTAEHARVKEIAPQWSQDANVRFEFVQGGASDIRISFNPKDGNWSMVGTSAIGEQQTMNLALRGESSTRQRRVILHEFGHALGLKHEHQSPAASIRWNEQAIIKEMWEKHGWDEAKVRRNILDRLDATQTNFTVFDKNSIMLYPIPNRWTIGDFETDYNSALSEMDKKFIGRHYP